MDDDLDCTRQSPNKNDTISVSMNGVKTDKVKRFATRSINEIYKIFHKNHPDIQISRSKFYELKPKWVKSNPTQDTCLCIYCENFRLLLIALGKLKGCKEIDVLKDTLLSIVVCSKDNLSCVFQECPNCPGKKAISLETLNLNDGEETEEVTYGFWYKGDLQEKTVPFENFLTELPDYTEIINIHKRIKDIQRIAILNVKNFAKTNSGRLVQHINFAES